MYNYILFPYFCYFIPCILTYSWLFNHFIPTSHILCRPLYRLSYLSAWLQLLTEINIIVVLFVVVALRCPHRYNIYFLISFRFENYPLKNEAILDSWTKVSFVFCILKLVFFTILSLPLLFMLFSCCYRCNRCCYLCHNSHLSFQMSSTQFSLSSI